MKLKSTIIHVSGNYLPGIIGIVVGVQEPTPVNPGAYAEVKFERKVVTCYWQELEVLS